MSAGIKERLPSIYLSHGGGPCFFMESNPPGIWDKMADWLKSLGDSIGTKPKAIIVISGHWEEKDFSVMSNPEPNLFFDYYGFPDHTYELEYKASGSPELAAQVYELLTESGIPVKVNSKRGFDHGVFIPFKLIYPDADIPIIQLSLKDNLDPEIHIKVGKALLSLREQGVLIVGSGSSFHNFSAWGPKGSLISEKFDDWLTDVVAIPDSEQREKELEKWDLSPAGRDAHPREEHLIPLMVVAGAAGNDSGKKVFSDNIGGVTLSAFQFG